MKRTKLKQNLLYPNRQPVYFDGLFSFFPLALSRSLTTEEWLFSAEERSQNSLGCCSATRRIVFTGTAAASLVQRSPPHAGRPFRRARELSESQQQQPPRIPREHKSTRSAVPVHSRFCAHWCVCPRHDLADQKMANASLKLLPCTRAFLRCPIPQLRFYPTQSVRNACHLLPPMRGRTGREPDQDKCIIFVSISSRF